MILLIISSFSIIFTISYIVFFAVAPPNGNGGYEEDYSPSIRYNIIPPTLEPIIPTLSTDGNIRLDWNDAETINSDLLDEISFSYYRVFRRKDGKTWELIINFPNIEYLDCGLTKGTYEYKIQSVFSKLNEIHNSDFSNVHFVVVGIITLPSNPSIRINDGDETTDSFTITLTLYCDDADEMKFQIYIGTWIDWVNYTTTYTMTLQEEYLDDNQFYIGVIFRNEDGESNEVFDDIEYEADGEPPPLNGDEDDYTLILYVLLGVLVGLIGIGVFLKYRNQIIKSK